MYHKYLERQIKKYLGEIGHTDEKMESFLKAVSDSYANYERDRELSEHAFSINELEYQAINRQLKEMTAELETKVAERTKELADLALFPLENPNPVFRTTINGEIIFRNPVSKNIREIFFNGKLYTTEEFFLMISKHISTSGTFDIVSGNKEYILNFKRGEGQTYINFYGTEVTEKNILRRKSQENFQRLNDFLESTEDAYYIIHSKNKEKDLITSKWSTIFGFDSFDCNDILAERKKCIKEASLKTYNAVFNKLKSGEKHSFQYNVVNRETGQEFWLSESVSKYTDKETKETIISGRISDITRERLYAIQIQESEERFRNLVEAIPVMVWVSNENNIVTYSNKAFKNLMGFGLEDIKGPEDYARFVHPEDKEIAVREWRNNVSRKKPILAEYRVKDAKGIYRNVMEKAVPRFYADGSYAGFIGAYFDLTEEKSAQQSLVVEKEKLELLTQNSPDIIILADQNGVIEYVSPSTTRLLEYDELRLINSNVSDFICKTCYSSLKSTSWLVNAKSKTKKFEYTMLSKSGKKIWVESVLSLVKNPVDKSVKILMHNRDISSFKQAEQALKESELKYRSLFENMQLGVMEVDLNDRILWVNHSFEKMAGYKFNEIKGKLAHKLFLKKEISEKLLSEVQKERKQKKESIYEIEMLKKNGQLANVVISGSPVIDINGNVRGSVGIHWDVTEIRKMERMLEEEKVIRQKEVMKATLNAEERQREVLGNELHDGVGQILTYTTLFLQMAASSNNLDPALFGKAQTKVAEAMNEVRRISRSLVPPALLDLGLREAIVELINQYTEFSNIKFDIKCKSDDLIDLDFDAKRTIYRIIQEMVNNSIKHAQADVIKIEIKRNKSKLAITCKDNGLGFNVEKVKKGVGLKSITNRAYFYGGNTKIDSALKKGTIFTVELPLKNIV